MDWTIGYTRTQAVRSKITEIEAAMDADLINPE